MPIVFDTGGVIRPDRMHKVNGLGEGDSNLPYAPFEAPGPANLIVCAGSKQIDVAFGYGSRWLFLCRWRRFRQKVKHVLE